MASSLAASLEPVESHSAHDKEVLEPHCWKCRNPYTDVKCQKCPRTFHTKCLDLDTTSITHTGNVVTFKNHPRLVHMIPAFRIFKMITCVECLVSATTDAMLSESSQEERRVILLQILDSIPSKYSYFNDYHELKEAAYKIDVNSIKKNVCEDKYRNVSAILADVKFITHNVAVYENGYEGRPRSEIMDAATNLKEDFEIMVSDYENCPYCFIRLKKKDTRIAVCTKPHLLVWVKVGTVLWPALVNRIEFKQEKYQVHVIYFGKNKFSGKFKAELNDCFLYNDRKSKSKQAGKEIKTCENYKTALASKFGAVVLPANNEEIPLDLNLEDALLKMFPDWKERY